MSGTSRETIVVKLGGSTLGGQAATGAPDTTLTDLLRLAAEGVAVAVVHGGGNAINGLLKQLGQEPRFQNGLRVTDQSALAAALMMMRGQINAELVAAVNRAGHAQGVSAIGLSGLDGRLLEARRETAHGDIGLVGEIVKVNLAIVELALANGFMPLIAPFAVAVDDPAASIYNINADNVAAHLAAALGASACVFLTDVPGVLDNQKQTIPQLNPASARQLITEGVISGGMIPKIGSALKALEGAAQVLILDGRPSGALYEAVRGQQIAGTRFLK